MQFVNDRIRAQVKAEMKERGLTQQQVADELGVDRIYVNRMLNGATSQVPVRWAEMLAFLNLELTVAKVPEEDGRVEKG